MRGAADAPSYLYTIAWAGLLVIFFFYIAIGLVLRRRPRRVIRATRYEPPDGISPAAAAFLVESGRFERAFASAIVSLAAKKHLKIEEKGDIFTLNKLRDADPGLPPEEAVIHAFLFPQGLDSTSFYGADSCRLVECYKQFKPVIHEAVTSAWMNMHVVIWIVGLCYSVTVLEPILFSMPGLGKGLNIGSLAYAGLLIFIGGSSFVGALRVWPTLFRKLATFLPGSRSAKRPLNLNDAIPLFLTMTASFGFILLAVLTSTKFAGFLAAAVAMNVFSWHPMNAPSSAGREVLTELAAFREFLDRTEADRLSRQNLPGYTPRNLDMNDAYAVALCVHCGWGEEFAANILDLIEVDEAYSPLPSAPQPDPPARTLSLFGRNR